MRVLLLIFVLLAAGCADIPALDATVTAAGRSAPYPPLVPLAQIPTTLPARDGPEAQAADAARIAALQARAAALRQTAAGALQ